MSDAGTIFLGSYRARDSFINRLDPLAKLLPVLLIILLSMITQSFAFYLVTLLSLWLLLRLSGMTAAELWRGFKPLAVVVATTILYHALFGRDGGNAILTIGSWELTRERLTDGAFYSMRMLVMLSAFMLITLTTAPSELAEGATRLLAPLRKLKVPVNDIGLILHIALRFIPILFDEYAAIRNAQIMRGVRFSGSFTQRVKKATAILIPVFAATIARADALAIAVQTRGYDSFRPRTIYTHTHFGWVAGIVGVGSSLVVILLYRFIG